MKVKTITFKFRGTPKQMLIPVTIEYVNDSGFIERKEIGACIDTGATQSGIDGKLADSLNFTTLGITKLKTAAGLMMSGIHTVNVVFNNGMRFDDIEIMEVEAGVDFIIGMDILGKGDFVFSHKSDCSLFSFRCPTADKGERFVSSETKLTLGEQV